MLRFSLKKITAAEVLDALRSLLEQLAGEIPEEAPAQV
jgi:hypothetical protein